MKFRKKPVVIDAWQVREVSSDVTEELPSWLLHAICAKTVEVDAGNVHSIKTLEGTMRAEKGDWIIRGVKGELYPCKPDIFAATYESVTP